MNSTRENKSGYSSFSDYINEMISEETNIISKATSILQDQIHLGVKTVKQLEHTFLDVDKLRSEDPSDTLYRFRRDAHDIVDIFMDLLKLSINTLVDVSKNAIRVNNNNRNPTTSQQNQVIYQMKKGETGEIQVPLVNHDRANQYQITVYSSSFVNPKGDEIKPSEVEFDPPSITINPGEEQVLTIRITIRPDLSSGTYTGVLLAEESDTFQYPLKINIEP